MKRLLIAAAVAATFAVPSAFADSSAFATLGPISVTLYDLKPLDGIAASITFASDSQSYAYSYSYRSISNDNQGVTNYSAGAWDPVSAASSMSLAAGASSLTGSGPGSPSGAVLSSSSGSTNPFGAYTLDYVYNVSGAVGASSFTLSANTLVVFSAAASISGSSQGPSFNSGNYGDQAYSSVSIDVYGSGPSGSGKQNVNDNFSNSVDGFSGDPMVYTFSQSKAVGASFLNLTTGDLSGSLDISVSSQVYSSATPVPEPETYAMLLAGLGLMGAIARRKNKKS